MERALAGKKKVIRSNDRNRGGLTAGMSATALLEV
jgi:hypothetical protein